MNDYTLIKDLTILLLVSLPINILFHKIKLPSTIGFLVAGVIIGPYELHWINDPRSINHLAEIGVVLLLFVIGLEFSLAKILKNLTEVIGGGIAQLVLTTLAIFLMLTVLGLHKNQAFTLGLLAALSSTAIVLKMITDQAEIDTLYGRLCIGILLFQDVCVVPVMIIVPLLAQTGETSFASVAIALAKSILALASIFLLSRLLVPRTLKLIGRIGSKEHLTLFVILIILGTGWVSQSLGLSLALGAFIAGLIISDSEYTHQIILDILPLRDYFVSIFFISIGMILNVDYFLKNSLFCLGLTFAAIILKIFLTFLACWLFRNPFRISLIVGIRLAQVGEFSLLIADKAMNLGLFPKEMYQTFLIVSILSMLVAPLCIKLSTLVSLKISSLLTFLPAEKPGNEREAEATAGNHVIIAGYGLGGQHLSRVLRETKIHFIVLELDGERIKLALAEKMNVLYGDATHRDVLLRAGIKSARMMVFYISDYASSRQGVKLARELSPNAYIMVRTRYASQVEELKSAGANEVIPEEFETSIEVFARVLKEYHIPNNIIENQIDLIRLEGYAMFRGVSLSMESLGKFSTFLTASLTESFLILNDSWAQSKRLEEVSLKTRTGVTLIAVVRAQKVHTHPAPEFQVEPGDILVLFGNHAQLSQSLHLLQFGV